MDSFSRCGGRFEIDEDIFFQFAGFEQFTKEISRVRVPRCALYQEIQTTPTVRPRIRLTFGSGRHFTQVKKGGANTPTVRRHYCEITIRVAFRKLSLARVWSLLTQREKTPERIEIPGNPVLYCTLYLRARIVSRNVLLSMDAKDVLASGAAPEGLGSVEGSTDGAQMVRYVNPAQCVPSSNE